MLWLRHCQRIGQYLRPNYHPSKLSSRKELFRCTCLSTANFLWYGPIETCSLGHVDFLSLSTWLPTHLEHNYTTTTLVPLHFATNKREPCHARPSSAWEIIESNQSNNVSVNLYGLGSSKTYCYNHCWPTRFQLVSIVSLCWSLVKQTTRPTSIVQTWFWSIVYHIYVISLFHIKHTYYWF